MIETLSFEVAVVVDTLIVLLAIAYLVLSLDDIVLDLFWYLRRSITSLRPRGSRLPDLAKLDALPEQRIALFIPCWHEANIVDSMLAAAVQNIRYQNYEIFVGVYPNDEETCARVDVAAARFSNVHKVVNPRPGPTTKAQNLNAMFDQMRELEGDRKFSVVVLHDVEDVIHPLSFALFNACVPRHDMVQLPVFPLERPARYWTSWTYADEFAENHLKDLVIREAIGAFVPCAGVGCAFSRSCLDAVAATRGGEVFSPGALTEDYQLSLDLKLAGFRAAFIQCRLTPAAAAAQRAGGAFGYVATRAYFPHTFSAAIRQKARWITGICFQTWEARGWRGPFPTRYALYRDRKGVLGHVLCFAGYPVMVAAFSLSGWHALDPRATVAVFRHDFVIYALLYAVLAVSAWRILLRAVHVATLYGFAQGVLSIVRFPLGNLLNGCATVRAAHTYARAKLRREPLRWAKTDHVFPTDPYENGALVRARRAPAISGASDTRLRRR